MRVRPDLRIRLERGGLVSGVSALGLALVMTATGGPAYDGASRAAAQPSSGSATVTPAGLPAVPVPTAMSAPAPRPVPAAPADEDVQGDGVLSPGRPLSVVLPRLDVRATVTPIAVRGGVLVPPVDPRTLGWWRGGAAPGSTRGSALITGHTVSTGGGALDDLELLRVGDRVRVRTRRGTARYVVSDVRIYRKARLARHAARVFSQRVPGRLVLVTCEDWNGATYLSNVVVIAYPLH